MLHKKQMNRRIILSTLLLIVISLGFSSQPIEIIQNLDFNSETNQTPRSSAFEGTGKHFQITQYATAVSSTYNVNPVTLSSFTLTNGWTAENITILAENVTRYRNPIQNPTCDYDYDLSEYPNWEYYTSNGTHLVLNPQSNRLSLDVGYGTINPDEIAYFNQTVNIDEEEDSTKLVEFSFDARMYNSPGQLGLYLFGAVIIGGIEHNNTIDTTTDTLDTYQTYSMQYYLSDEGQDLPNEIEFRFGAYVNQTLVYGSDPTHNDVHFDNIEYNIYTYVNQTYALVAQDQDDLTDYYYSNTSSGVGEFSIAGQKSYGSTQDVQFQIRQNSTFIGLVEIENLTITSDLIRTINTSSSSYQDGAFGSSDDILWTFDASPSIPVSYVNKRIEIEKPSDWKIISAIDPFLTNQTASCLDLGYGTTKFLIPSSVFSSGNWEFRARSKSWFDEAKLEFWTGSSFIEKTNFYVGEDFHVKTIINNTVPLTGTELNFSMYYPNGTIFQNQTREPLIYENYFGNYTINLSMPVGLYTAEVSWVNNASVSYIDKVGYKTFEFYVLHNSQLTAIDSFIETVPGEPLLIIVEFQDTDTGEGIDPGIVEYNSTFGQSGQLGYLGSGYYFLDLNTSALDYTDYFLSFNASKQFYENQTISDLVQIRLEREGMILDVPRQVNSVSANSYAQFNFNLTGEISETFLTADSLTTDWSVWYEITEQAQGQYQLNVSTTGVTTSSFPETFVINIEANKTDYTNTTDIVLLQVNPIETFITANQTFIEVSQGSPFSVKVNLTDKGLGTLVSGTDCNATWSLGTTITPVGDEYVIDYVTTGLALDQYTSVITLNRSGNQSKTVIVSVLVNPVQTAISANTSFIRVSQGSQFTVRVNYTEFYGGALIPSATCSVTWEPGVYYEINPIGDEFDVTFNTTGLDLDQYTATIQLSKSGYQTKNVFVTVLVDPISTAIAANQTFVTIEPGKLFSIHVNYTNAENGLLIDNANCSVTWDRDANITSVATGFVIDFNTSSLGLGQYSALIQISKAGYETQNLFISVLLNPISASIAGNTTLIVVEQGKIFSVKTNFTNVETGLLISGANCTVTWGRDANITEIFDEFYIDFDTTGLSLGQYTAIVQISKDGYESQSLFITVLIEPVSSSLNILFVEPVEYFVGDTATFSVEYIVDGLSFDGGTVNLVGDFEGAMIWNGTAYTLDVDTASLDPKIYFSQIFAQAPGVQTQIYDLYIRIQPVELEVTVSRTSITFPDQSLIYITIFDSSHGSYLLDANITCDIGGVQGTIISFGNGTYSIDLNQFGLEPAISPYDLNTKITNPYGDDETVVITVVYLRNLNLVWWIAGAVAGTVILGLSSLFIYNRYVKQTRFQRDVAFVKKNLPKPKKTRSIVEPSRDEMVSDIINKEIDNLL